MPCLLAQTILHATKKILLLEFDLFQWSTMLVTLSGLRSIMLDWFDLLPGPSTPIFRHC